MPTVDSGDDLIRIGGPNERLWLIVVLVDEAIDDCLKVDDRVTYAPFEAPLSQLGEEALDGIESGRRCRREVEGPAGMAGEPLANLFMLVGAVIVEDDVDDLAGRDVALDHVQEAKELLVSMALHGAADHGAVEHIEGSEQGRRSVTLVIVTRCRAWRSYGKRRCLYSVL